MVDRWVPSELNPSDEPSRETLVSLTTCRARGLGLDAPSGSLPVEVLDLEGEEDLLVNRSSRSLAQSLPAGPLV